MDKKHFNKHDYSKSNEKDDFLGKKRTDITFDYSYSRDRNQNNYNKHDYHSKFIFFKFFRK